MSAGSLALGFVALAWFVGDRRFNAGLWPLWAMSGVFAAATLANLAFDGVSRWTRGRGAGDTGTAGSAAAAKAGRSTGSPDSPSRSSSAARR